MAEAEDRGRAAERAAMMNALRAAGVSEDIIEKACSDAERGRFGNAMIDMFDGVLR